MKRKKIERLTIEDCRHRCRHYNNVNPYGWEFCEANGIECKYVFVQGCLCGKFQEKGQ